MFANQTDGKARLTVAPQQTLVEFPLSSPFHLPGEAEFPSPPALPSSLVQLELRLSDPVADLQDISNIIRNDIGLTVQLLRLAAREIQEPPLLTISEIVVEIGLEKLGRLVACTKSLPDPLRGPAGPSACERFWMHSRLTALVAEELASQSSEVRPEEAYLSGLLFHLGDLPAVLGWAVVDSVHADSADIGYRIAQAWQLPRALADVIGGNWNLCRTRESRALLNIVTDADSWASRLEFLAMREYESLRPKRRSCDR